MYLPANSAHTIGAGKNERNERMKDMANKQQFSQEMKNYYDALPAFVQESISQSSSSFNNLDELRAFAEKVRSGRKGDSCGHC